MIKLNEIKNFAEIAKSDTLYQTGGTFLNRDKFYLLVYNWDERVVKNTLESEKQLPEGVEPYTFHNIAGEERKSIKIPFQFLEDVRVTERAPSYSSIPVIGRWEPLQIWNTMSPLTINLTLRYSAIGNVNEIHYDEVWVDKMTSLIKSLAYPHYPNIGSGYNVPPRLFLMVGDLITDLPCFLSSCGRDWSDSPKSVAFDQTIDSTSLETYRPVDVAADTSGIKNIMTKEEFENKKREFDKKIQNNFLPLTQKMELTLTGYYETEVQVDSATIRNRYWRGVPIVSSSAYGAKLKEESDARNKKAEEEKARKNKETAERDRQNQEQKKSFIAGRGNSAVLAEYSESAKSAAIAKDISISRSMKRAEATRAAAQFSAQSAAAGTQEAYRTKMKQAQSAAAEQAEKIKSQQQKIIRTE